MSVATLSYQSLWNCRFEEHRNRDVWLSKRADGIGASESPAIFGVGYASQSPVTIWHSKVSGEREEISPALQKVMNRGVRMEPVIAAEFEDETELPTVNPGDFTIMRHPEFDWLFATIDRVGLHDQWGPVPVELKYINGRFRKDWDVSVEPPLKYAVQCQHQMAVTGTDHSFLVGLVGGDELVIRQIDRDQRFIDVMLKKLQEFWGYVEREEMPPVDESEATASALARIYPVSNEVEIELPVEAIDWDLDLKKVKQRLKELNERKRGIENQIKAEIGDAAIGLLPGGGKFTWKSQTRKGYRVEEKEMRVLRRTK